MDLDALRFANFSKFGEAVTDWEEMVKKLKDLQEDAEQDLKKKAVKARWAGVNAGVTREFIAKTAAEFADAHTQADTIAKILKDTHGELKRFSEQLNDAVHRGAKKNLTVTDTGGGTFRVEMNIHPDRAGKGTEVPHHSQQDVTDFRDEIAGILSNATQSDKSAKEVLKAIVDAVKYGFSDANYPDRDHAAQALKDAEAMANMAKHPKDMSLDDIAKFNGYLKKYHDDPLFSERLATQLGAKKTLQFWTDVTDKFAGARGADLDQLKSLQKNMSMTLATASFSDSGDMQDWKKNILKETNTNFLVDPTDPNRSPRGALGAQVMSSLMRQGQFDTEFLDEYRAKLFKADLGAGSSSTKELWETGNQSVDLVFGKGDGRDPLNGLFDALSHNPEAAVNAFQSKSDLNHMLGTSKYTDRGTSLGHALEAAVTGVAAGDETHAALPHSKAQVEIMRNVMHAVADPGRGVLDSGGGSLVGEAIGESFGHMAASYMPEISRALGGPSAENVFLSTSTDPTGLERTDVTRFLTEVAHDANGRAAIRYGETIYTGSLLDAHLANPSLFDGTRQQVLSDISQNAGIIEGIVGHSVADADIGSAQDAEKAENDATKQQGEFFKAVLSAGVGVGSVALVPATPAGALAGAIGGGFFGGVSSMAVDRIFDGRELDSATDQALYRTGQELNKTQDSVNQQTQWSVEDAMKRHHVQLPKDGTMDFVRNAVNHGWSESDRIMEDAEKRPTA
ncbi:hypothetical protein EOT10_15875 [Streptomyces antnestii]|uniref:Uncharacterized protein n=1 Tax=Streptomyces antnestii TaxID=2494256 RepID=A0A3S2VG32_9ACTN|nr:DUF6571 family protein [Streptomyces sp. San01]RVU24480.1 hypothetical protein EOT10_15875 [Streptomyces sp. San01]